MRYFFIILCGVFAAMLHADEGTSRAVINWQAMKAQKKALFGNHLELTDAEAAAFWPVYDVYQVELDGVRARQAMLILDFAEHYAQMTDEKAMELVQASLALRLEHQVLLSSAVAEMKGKAPGVQIARFVQIENKIDAMIQAELALSLPFVADTAPADK
jgi:hypothetical protein